MRITWILLFILAGLAGTALAYLIVMAGTGVLAGWW